MIPMTMTRAAVFPRQDARTEAMCFGLAISLHIALLVWNPTLFKSHVLQPIERLVNVEIIEEATPPPGVVQAPKRMTLFETLKQMLIKPKEEIEVAPRQIETPQARPMAEPIRPLLKEAGRSRLAPAFQPKSLTEEEPAIARQGSSIDVSRKTPIPVAPAGPTLQAKTFGGIKASDLPFQLAKANDDSISASGQAIPIAVGDRSAKAALNYSAPALQESKSRRAIGSVGVPRGATPGDALARGTERGPIVTEAMARSAPAGGSGESAGAALKPREGSYNAGASLFGFKGARGGSASGNVAPGSAALEMPQGAGANPSGKGITPKPAFEIGGPIGNRPILSKVIPKYPAWAEEQGIITSVRLYFTVMAQGNVNKNIQITKTSGYPELDKIVVDALLQWRFKPVEGVDDPKSNWGIITFNFSLT